MRAICVVFLAMFEAVASAQTLTVIPIVQTPAVEDATIPTGVVQVFVFDGPIERYDWPDKHPYFKRMESSGPNEFRIETAIDSHDQTANLSVDIGGPKPCNVTLRLRASRYAHVSAAKIIRVDLEEIRELREDNQQLQANLVAASATITQQAKQHAQEVAAVREEAQNTIRDHTTQTMVRALSEGFVSTTLSTTDHCTDPGDVAMCGMEWVNTGKLGVLRFDLLPSEHREYVGLQILDEADVDHATWVSVDGAEPVRADQLHLTLAPLQRVTVSVGVNNPKPLEQGTRASLARPNVMADWKYVDLRPPKREPPDGFGRITISVQPSIGAVFVVNPVDDTETGTAMTTSVGIRGSYAVHKMFALEGELAGIQSSDARFEDVPFNGATGDMLRSTKGARVLFGGIVRLGQKYQPFARLGIGAQIADWDVRFMTNQGTIAGPSDGFSLAALGYFGAGMDVHLGQHWVVGGGFALTVHVNGEQSVEGGIQLGYGWGGYVRD